MPLIYHSQLTSFVLDEREGGNPSSRSVKNKEEKMDVQFRVLTGQSNSVVFYSTLWMSLRKELRIGGAVTGEAESLLLH